VSYSIIGGADGPTSIFVAGQIGSGWFNGYGLIFLILLLIPNIVYAVKYKDATNTCTDKWALVMEQIGRYGSMFFMVFTFGSMTQGWASVTEFMVYLLGSTLLMVAYWIVWMLYFAEVSMWKSMALAIIPTLLFLFGGITMRNIPAIVLAVVFGIGHIYVTYKNQE